MLADLPSLRAQYAHRYTSGRLHEHSGGYLQARGAAQRIRTLGTPGDGSTSADRNAR